MSDEQVTPTGTEPPKPTFEVKVTLPPDWLLQHWQTYGSAQQEYIRQCRERKIIAETMLSRYFGAKALIDNGYVHIDGNPEDVAKAVAWVATDSPPLKWIGWLNRFVAEAIEEAFFVPLA